MRLTYDEPRVIAWVEGRLQESFPGARAAGVESAHGEMLAGVVYHEFRWPSIEISMAAASPRWATRRNIATLLAYPFLVLDCRRITCLTAPTNVRTKRFLIGIGFKFEGLIRDAFPEGDAECLGLIRSECRWV